MPFKAVSWSTAGTFSWTVPDNPPVYMVWVTLLGGGGGGHTDYPGSSRGGQGGGSGEQLVQMPLSVTPTETLTVVVGSGGAGGYFPPVGDAVAAQPGGNTSVGPYVALGGGIAETQGNPFIGASYGGGVNGGLQGNSVTPLYSETFGAADGSLWYGGAGGGAEDDPNHEQGASMPGGPSGGRLIGGAGVTKVTNGPGGGGGATLFGVGAAGAGDSVNGINSTFAGTGGGGCGYFPAPFTFLESGGNGHAGKAQLFFIQP